MRWGPLRNTWKPQEPGCTFCEPSTAATFPEKCEAFWEGVGAKESSKHPGEGGSKRQGSAPFVSSAPNTLAVGFPQGGVRGETKRAGGASGGCVWEKCLFKTIVIKYSSALTPAILLQLLSPSAQLEKTSERKREQHLNAYLCCHF